MLINGNKTTVNDAFHKGIAVLKNANIITPVLEAGVMLCYVLNCDKTYIYSHGDSVMPDAEASAYFTCLEKRVSGVPLQYITGQQEFMSLMFRVSPDVLIPRQDTEILVETVIDYAKRINQSTVKILDIGTGSGCIAVSLAYFLKNSLVTAVDISQASLDVACSNAESAGVSSRVQFIKSNLFENIYENERFDIIVSNPPYITTGDIENLQVEVKCHEPAAALDGGPDGLEFYRSIIMDAHRFLNKNGFLAFEVGFDQSREVAALFKDRFYGVNIIKDLSSVERVVTGALKY